ncbi:hypothetical protein [Vitreoscilla filiformis]|uniref:hypothetical protein n=1 Tax=Vitreoscilla filiformis TaxID=63 RepID=UPI0012FDAFA8|nr:hypothetical protein [Vitreoscilla filiformis]
MKTPCLLLHLMIAAIATSAQAGTTSKNSGSSTAATRSVSNARPVQPSTTRLSTTELRRTKENYNQHVLNNKPDPYPSLMRGTSKIAAGPQGSSLLAVAKIPNSGKGKYYKNQANKAIASNQDVANTIRKNHLRPGETLVIDPKGSKNPHIQAEDGSQKRLEWHHSPNHIGSVSLIPTDTHRITGGKALLHYDKKKGGNEMYNTQYKQSPKSQP